MSNNLYLFANNNEGTAEDLGYYRLYNMKIDGDSEGVESGVNYVDYIYGDRTNDCRLDTGLAFTKSNKYVMGINIIDSNSYSTFTGGFDYNWVTNRLQYGGLNVYPTWTNGGEGRFKNSWTTVGNEIVFDNGVLSVNGVSASNVNTPFDSDATGNNQIINLRYARLRYFRVYDKSGTLIQELLPCVDNEGISCVYDTVAKKYIHASNGTISHKKKLRDFQPVLDSNGVPCLMDKVNKKYYYDKNGNLFDYAEQSEYQRVGYIRRHTSSDYVPTGLSFTFDENTVIKFGFNLNSDGGSEIFQIKNGITVRTSDNTKMRVGDLSLSVGQADNKNHDAILTTTNLTVSWGDTPYEFTDLGLTGGTGELIIFVGNNYYGTGCINYLKIYQSDELVFDGIPVLDNNNTPCMYDLVTETFFYNQGTGTFGYGIEEDECPKADYVEYLESNGSGYIDTKIIPKEDYTYEITCTSYSDSELFAYGISGNYNVGAILLRVCTKLLATATNGGITYASWNALKQNEPITIIMNANHCVLNGVEIATNSEGKQWIKPENGSLYLFGANRWNGAIGFSGKIYEFKITSDSEGIVAHFKPCLDEEGVPCMYDIVSGGYFYKQNGKEFTHGKSIGYTPIKYIESNGTQYIDTGVVVNDNTYMDIDYRAVAKEYTPVEYLQGDGASWIDTGIYANHQYKYEIVLMDSTIQRYENYFGANKNEGRLERHLDQNALTFNYFNRAVNTSNDTFLTDTKYIVTLDKRHIYIDNVLQKSGDTTDSIDPYTYTTTLFAGRYDGNIQTIADMKLYSFKMWNENGELVFDGIPVLDNEGTPCIYDKISEQYLYNQGTGTFGYGDAIAVNGYLMNDFYTDTTYKYKEIDTTVEPNLTASEGATLTLGSTYMAYLSEDELEQATKNGWIIE